MNESISFKSVKHKVRFLTAIQQIGKIYAGKLDPAYGAALYILASDLALWEKASDYVAHNGIDFESMLQEVDFSGGEPVLVRWASNLFNGNAHIDPLELLQLDESNFQVALSSLKLRRYTWYVDDFQPTSNSNNNGSRD